MPPPPPPTEQPTGTIPFEDPALGFFDGLVETVKDVFLHPVRLFRRTPETSDIGKAILFLLILSFVGMLFAGFWELILGSTQDPRQFLDAIEQLDLPPELRQAIEQAANPTPGQRVFGFLTNLFLGPVIVLILVFLGTGLSHLLLMLVGGAHRDYGASFRVGAYSSALLLLCLVPLCGGLISLVWTLVLWIVGLAAAHRAEGWQAALAVLLPPALCCACCCLGAFLLGMAISAAGAG